uniref:Putative secreted protein n=1 Tax=Ixodes ricinus TaxID=34613 RepID=V5H677_IXORI
MRSSFIFCLLGMYFIASANADSCSGIAGVQCRIFCYYYNGSTELKQKNDGAPCKMPGGRDGKCENGECIRK